MQESHLPGSASAAATVICTGTIRTRRSAGIWTERSVRSSGPSRRWAAPSHLLRCAQALVRRQQAFSESRWQQAPRLADIAAELSIHESTVSRAVREKYLQCARGVYPSAFLHAGGGRGEGQSAHEIKINCSS